MTENIVLEEKFRETGGKRPYVQRLFGRIARIYDPMNRLMSFGLDRRWRAFGLDTDRTASRHCGLDQPLSGNSRNQSCAAELRF